MSAQELNKKKDTLEQLKVDFKNTTDDIRKILSQYSDVDEVKQTDRTKLRSGYSKAAQLANNIASRTIDVKERDKYKQNAIKLSEMAGVYGSVITSRIPKTEMDDVKGLDEVKELIRSFIFMAKNTDLVKYYKLEGGLGMLMYGAPGTGKTMFAEAIANSMNLPLFIVTPADIYKSYVGESEQAVKQIFQEIDACEDGAILFVDECESIFSRRTKDTKDYKSAVTTELLQRMNGFGIDGSKRIMIAATNRPDEIDPAYLRYKRFSHIVNIPPPDKSAKRAIIESKLKDIKLSDDISIDEILEMTECTFSKTGSKEKIEGMYSAADLCGIIEEACRMALTQIEEQKGDKAIPLTREMFEKAFKKMPPSISPKTFALYENFKEQLEF